MLELCYALERDARKVGEGYAGERAVGHTSFDGRHLYECCSDSSARIARGWMPICLLSLEACGKMAAGSRVEEPSLFRGNAVEDAHKVLLTTALLLRRDPMWLAYAGK